MIIVNNNASLKRLNTMRLPARSRMVVTFDDPSLCLRVMEITQGLERRVIGGGSNILPTGRFDGAIIRYTGPNAGWVLDEVVTEACQLGCVEAASLSGIPGTVGGAAVQNAGAYGVEFSEFVTCVHAFDFQQGKMVEFLREECGYGYRTSVFKTMPAGRCLITRVDLDFSSPSPDVEAALAKREQVLTQRAAKLPAVDDIGSAGSYFKNPIITEQQFAQFLQHPATAAAPNFKVNCGVKLSAAWLIERAGFKGVVRGNAGTYPKHALIMINASGHAKPADILTLEQEIIDGVKRKFGIILEPEVVKI